MIKKCIFMGVLVFMFTSPSIAADKEYRKMVESVLKTMNVQQHMDHIPDLLGSMIDEKQFPLDDNDIAKLQRIFRDTYQVESIYELVIQNIVDQKVKEHLTKVKKLLDQDTVQNFLGLEKQMSDPSIYQEFLQYTLFVKNNPPSEYRINDLQLLDQNRHGISSFVDVNVFVYKTVMDSVNTFVPIQNKWTSKRLKYLENEFWLMVQNNTEATVMMTYLFTYQDVLDQELQTYISFFKHKDIQWFYEVYKKALFESLDICAEKVKYDIEVR